ncbi:MAG: ureE [Segetibacter sp.]|jgi:urease accessory protein|nr:ureE [Segetibacter sp.]
MIIKQKIGNIKSFDLGSRSIDIVSLEWYETNKRIIHKKAKSGREIVMKFMNEGQALTEGDVLWQDETSLVVVEISPCEVISIQPSSMYHMASLCYEIGNKHLPLFYHQDEIMVPYEAPLFNLLSAAGHKPVRQNRKLLNALKTTVSPHTTTDNKQSLFSKILQLTTSSPDV